MSFRPPRKKILRGAYQPPRNQNGPKTPSREGIANLAAACACFEPVLVNENTPDGPVEKWNGEFRARDGKTAPNFPQFINTAARAVQEVHNFIQNYEEVKNNYQVLSLDAQSAYRIAHIAGIHTDSLENTMDLCVGRYNQLLDVLTKLGYETITTPADTERLQKIAREAVLRFRSVNMPEGSAPGQPDSKTLPFQEPPPDVSGGIGAT